MMIGVTQAPVRLSGGELLVDPVVPPPMPRLAPLPVELPRLSRVRPSQPEEHPLLGIARPDPSGRLSARGLLRALNWGRGHRLGLDIVDGAIVMFSSAAGPHTVADRGELVLPASARRMADIEDRIATAQQVLARLGLTVADLRADPEPARPVPSMAEYLPRVEAATGPGARRTYGRTGDTARDFSDGVVDVVAVKQR
jgi:hypothetical protein